MKEETKQTRQPSEELEAAPAAEIREETPAPSRGGAAAVKKGNRFDAFFGITESGSTFKTEIVAGVTTFMAMVYILMVNADMFQNIIGGSDPYGAAYIATAIGAIAGTMFMALLARMPLALASGMGVNAFLVFTLILGGTGLTYANCMVFTLIDGLILVLLTATGLRQKIFEAIPAGVRHAIPVGIGLFIAFIGMQNAGIILADPSTKVKFVSFNVLAEGWAWGNVVAPLVALLGVIAIAIMVKKNVKGSILWGILGSTFLYYILVGLGCAWQDKACLAIFKEIGEQFQFNPIKAFVAWGKDSAGVVFTEGFDFSGYFALGGNAGTLAVLLITTVLSLCMLTMFDTIGTLYGACEKGKLLDKNGAPRNMNKMMLSDAIGTCVASVAGTSAVTTFVESSAGVSAGGKTGFTALITAALFFVAMFLSPLAKLIPSAATATALIWVGVLMMTSVTKIQWEDVSEAVVAFLTFIVMVLGYSISKGIGVGILAYILVQVCTGNVKKISIPTWVIGALFLATFILT